MIQREDAARPGGALLATVVLLGSVVTGILALAPATAASSNGKECKARDANHDGEIGPGETQECGGDVYGEGGHDGRHLPEPEDGNTHQWVDNGLALHWSKPSDDERKIIIRDSVADSSSYDTKLGSVISDWGNSAKFKFVRQSAETDSTTRLNCPMPDKYGRVRVCNHDDYTFSFAGYANVRYNGDGHIQKGRVRVKNSVAEGSRRALLCQEVGHTLGLAHRSSTGSCMHQDASVAAASPDDHDYEQLRDQTHSHGGESDTGGAFSDLDTGGGIRDGCTSFVCYETSSHGHAHGFSVTVVSVKHLPNGGHAVAYGLSFGTAGPTPPFERLL